jgi:hypothetical protein
MYSGLPQDGPEALQDTASKGCPRATTSSAVTRRAFVEAGECSTPWPAAGSDALTARAPAPVAGARSMRVSRATWG